MLSTLRSATGGWIAKGFIGLLAMSFAVWGVADVFSGRSSDTLAEVGSRTISAAEYRNNFNTQLLSFSRRIGRSLTPDDARQLGFDRQVLSGMLRDAALEAQADSLKLAIPERLIAKRVAENKSLQNARGEFNAALFRNLLRDNGLSEQQFLASEHQTLLRAAISDTLQRGLSAPRTLVEITHRHRSEQRDAQYFAVSASETDIAEPSDSDLKSFYDKNKSLFSVPERRSFALLQALPKELAGAIKIGEAELKAAFEKRKESYVTPEKRTVQQITFANKDEAAAARLKFEGGMDFMALAKEKGLSEADVTLGSFTKTGFPDSKLAAAAFSLKQGDVSQPVEGKLSIVLMRVTKIEPGSEKTLEDVRADLLAKAQADLASDAALDLYNKVEDARAGGQSFKDIAKALNIKLVEVPAVSRSGLDAGNKAPEALAVARPEILKTAFESDVGVDNDVITTSGDGYIWLEVHEVVPAATLSFDKAKADVVQNWRARKRRDAARKIAIDLRKRAEAGEDFEALAKERGAEVKKILGIKRNEATPAFASDAVRALFAAPKDGYAISVDSDGKQAKVMKSSPVLALPFDPDSAEGKPIATALNTGLAGDIYAEYMSQLQNDVGVTINEQLWSRANGSNYQAGRN